MTALMEESLAVQLVPNQLTDIYCGDVRVGTFIIAMEYDGIVSAPGLPPNAYPLLVERLFCGLRAPLSRRNPDGKTDASEVRTIGYGDAFVTVEVKVQLEVGVSVREVRRVIRGVVEALLAYVEQREAFSGDSGLDLESLGLSRGQQVSSRKEHIYAVPSTGGSGSFATTCDGNDRSTKMGGRF